MFLVVFFFLEDVFVEIKVLNQVSNVPQTALNMVIIVSTSIEIYFRIRTEVLNKPKSIKNEQFKSKIYI